MMFIKQEERQIVQDLLKARRKIRKLELALLLSTSLLVVAVFSTIAMFERVCP